MQENGSFGTENKSREIIKKHGLSITGFDRVSNPFYDYRAKLLWHLSFLILTSIALWQINDCVYEYFYGKPAVNVEFSFRSELPMPVSVICPMEIFGINPATRELKREYEEVFRGTEYAKKEVYFSDFLRLPRMNIHKLWKHQQFDFEVDIKCSTSKTDDSCQKHNGKSDWSITRKNTSSGECVVGRKESNFLFFGPTTILKAILKAKNSSIAWSPIDFCLRGYQISNEESILYSALDSGFPGVLTVFAEVVAEPLEIVNVNAPKYPCQNGVEVERCVDQCTEKELYSRVVCRLPFMKNTSLPYCEDPEALNITFEASKDVMKKRLECRMNCPRKCYEFMYILSVQFVTVNAKKFIISLQIFDNRVQSIQEYYWYTTSSLFADVGGSIGFYMDSSFLTLIEVLEFFIIWVYSYSRRDHKISEDKNTKKPLHFYFSRRNRLLKQKKNLSESTYKQDINIGIAGFDRICSQQTSKSLKIIWVVIISISFGLCCLQIYDTIQNFLHGDPDTMLVPETNLTVKFPSMTFCPYRPFDHSELLVTWKESFAEENNLSIDSISVSQLMDWDAVNVLEFWDYEAIRDEQIVNNFVKCQKVTGAEDPGENIMINITQTKTLHGCCTTVNIEPEVRYRGTGTIFCFQINHLVNAVNTEYPLVFAIHDTEEDPRTLDPNLWIPAARGAAGISAFQAIKLEYLNRERKPCSSNYEVAKCRSQCYDYVMKKKAPCRLPFMQNSSMPICNSSKTFNQTLELAGSLLHNYMSNTWCNCPRKCKQYIFRMDRDDYRVPINLLYFVLQIPNNIFKVVKEYRKIGVSNVFANICGSLGLFLGISVLTILEFLEAIILLVQRTLNKKPIVF